MSQPVQAAPESVRRADSYQWVILATTTMVLAVTVLSNAIIGPLAPFLREALQIDRREVGLLTSASFLGIVLMAAPMGNLTDRVGVRRTLLIGPPGIVLFLLLLGRVTDFTQAMVVSLFGGMIYAASQPALGKAIVVWFPLRSRARAMAVKQIGIPIAGLVAAYAIPYLGSRFDWHLALTSLGLAVLVIAFVPYFVYREAPRGEQSPAPAGNWRAQWRFVLTNRDLWFLHFQGMGATIVNNSVRTYLLLFLTEAASFSVVAAGFYLGLVQWAAIAGQLGWGVVSDRLFGGHRKIPLFLTGAISAVAVLALDRVGTGGSAWSLAPVVILIGLSAHSWSGLHATMIAEMAGKELAATATGIGNSVSVVGTVLGPPLFGALADWTGSYALSWAFLAICSSGSALFSLLVREERRRAT
ncbi:MAG: MFS transporter [Chloroflexi bacterium]|nr:MFS transporter [Chloroflexota bacterium]